MALTQAGLVPVQPSTDELQDSRYRIEHDGHCTALLLHWTAQDWDWDYIGQDGSGLGRTGLDYTGQDWDWAILDRTGQNSVTMPKLKVFSNQSLT